jgi:hypothetical protein
MYLVDFSDVWMKGTREGVDIRVIIHNGETKLIEYAEEVGGSLTLGAGRPVCPNCVEEIVRTGATIVTPARVPW